MMPQREADQPMQQEQSEASYGRYEGDQGYNYQQFEEPEREMRAAGKLYTPPSDNKNVLRLVAFAMSLIALVVFAAICLIVVGGTGGWISFCAACLAVFIISAVVIDKIK